MDESELDEPSSVDDFLVTVPRDEEAISLFQTFFLRQIYNPFNAAWTLIKLGYEPSAPVQYHSPLALIGWKSPLYLYPNIFKYTYNLMKMKGFFTVITTGFFANATYNFIVEIFHHTFRRRVSMWMHSRNLVIKRRNQISEFSRSLRTRRLSASFLPERLMEEADLPTLSSMLVELLSLKTWKIIITQPFYVIMIRQIASLIGGETHYAWFPSAVRSIYRENGISGFFQGFIPRLMGELMFHWFYYVTCYFCRRLLFDSSRHSSESMNILRVIIYFTLRGYTYPFELTGCIMTLRGAHLAGSLEANSFAGWRDCKRQLCSTDQINRGWWPFFRSHVQKHHLSIDPNSEDLIAD